MAFLMLMLIIETPLLLSKEHYRIGQYATILIGPTFIVLALSASIARIRQSFIQIILPLNVLVRGLLILFMGPKICEGLTCLEKPLALVVHYMNIILFFCEANLFPFRLTSYLSVPVYFLLVSIHQNAQYAQLPKCSDKNGSKLTIFYTLLVEVLFLIPLYASLYMQAVSEIRTYLVAENNIKQQQLILEIFERQHDGVILIKNNHDQEADQYAKNVLFCNNNLSEILGGDVEKGLNEPLFKSTSEVSSD
jgi:hypothetical protein